MPTVTLTLTVGGKTYAWEVTEVAATTEQPRLLEDGSPRLLEDDTSRTLEAA